MLTLARTTWNQPADAPSYEPTEQWPQIAKTGDNHRDSRHDDLRSGDKGLISAPSSEPRRYDHHHDGHSRSGTGDNRRDRTAMTAAATGPGPVTAAALPALHP